MAILDLIKQTAFITGRIIHEGTGEPVVGSIRITAKELPVIDKVLPDGTFVLSGDLELLFPELATQNYQLNLTIRANSPQYRAGFIEHPMLAAVLSGNYDPDDPTIQPQKLNDLGTIALPADPVTIRGRVVEAKDPENPVDNATVEVLYSGSTISPEITGSDGRYSFDEIVVKAPATIKCSKGSTKQERTMLLDFSKAVNEEYFRL